MSAEMAKKARAEARDKANRLGGATNDPHRKVDASSWTPGPALNAERKTGARPIRSRIYKAGGKIQHDRAPRHAGKAPRGGYASGGSPKGYMGGESDFKDAMRQGKAARRANWKRHENPFEDVGMKRSGWHEGWTDADRHISSDVDKLPENRKSGGYASGGALTVYDTADANKKLGNFHDGAYKRGGMPGAGHDMAEIKKAVHKHEKHDHKGEPLTKLKNGGNANWMAEAFGKHSGKLHKRLGVAEDKKIPAKKLAKAAHSDDPTLAKEANLAKIGREYGKRSERASGGRAKGKTNINIVIAQPRQPQMPMPTPGPTRPPVMPPPPPAPPPQMAPPVGGPPPGPMPGPMMGRKSGGRTLANAKYPIKDGSASGEGRLEKTRAAERNYFRA